MILGIKKRKDLFYKMKLSLIIPVYNGEKKIEKCLQSLRNIKDYDVEFVIINDGSVDNTSLICEQYVKEDHRFRLINQANGGVSKARNTGIKESQGKYIGFVDADDEITNEFNNIIGVLNLEECSMFAFSHGQKMSESLEVVSRYLFVPGKNKKSVLYNNYLSGHSNCVWNNIYRADIIKENKIQFPEDMSMGEDSVFNAKYLKHCNEVFYIDKVGYIYYVDNNESASNAGKASYLKDFIKIYDNFQKLYDSCDCENVKFNFYGAYYINKIYAIIRNHGEQISRQDRKNFRESAIYKNITKNRYKSWRCELKKWYIKLYMCMG